MALRVWLPLNGTLDNIGVSGVNVEQVTTATFSNTGKIGKCLSGGKIKINATDVAKIFNNNAMTITFWYNNNTTTADTHAICGFSGNTEGDTDAVRSWDFFQYSTKNDFHWSMGTLGGGVLNGIIVDNTWTHFAINFNGSKVQIYINGELKNEHAGTSNFTFDKSYYIFSNHNQLINDFRIYDHCLSAKEVKEISQGLVLHYKLDGFSGGAGENLVKGSNTNDTSTNRWFGHSAVGGNTSTIEQDETGTYCVKVTRNEVEQSSWDYLSYDNFLRNNIKTSTSYTISFDCKPSVDGSIGFTGFVNGNATNYMTNSKTTIQGNCIANQWNHMVYQCKTIDSFDDITVGSQVVYFSRSTSLRGINVSVLFKNIKVEEGLTETAWTPNTDELGIDTTKATDSSGYGYDGAITGTISTFSNSNRYENSAIFNGNCANFIANVGFPKITKDITFSCWAYQTSTTSTSGTNTSNNRQYLISQGRDSVCSGFNLTVSNGAVLLDMGVSSTGGSSLSSGTSILNGWHMITGTFDGTNMKIYIDGILKGTKNPGVTEIDYTYGSEALVIGKMSYGYTSTASYFPFAGYINDVRVYATALSAEDILDLYHTPANIDNLQNIHAFELKEQSGNMFAGSPMTGTVTWDATNNYYTITSNPSTSTWGIGPAVGTSPKKIIPWGMSYILTYEVYSPTAAQWYIDYNNNDPTTSLSGNDNDNSRLRTGVNVPANTWTLITYGCSNTNETKNPDHLPLYDYSTGLGPVMTNISSAITWHMRNPQWYLVDADNKEHVYESGVFQANFIKEDNQSLYTSFRNEEKAAWAHGYIEK